MAQYSVIVGNVGIVHTGTSKDDALAVWQDYVRASIDGRGRAAGEPVTLTRDGEPIREHDGDALPCDDCGRAAPLTRLGDAHAGQSLCPACYATARLDVDAQGERIDD